MTETLPIPTAEGTLGLQPQPSPGDFDGDGSNVVITGHAGNDLSVDGVTGHPNSTLAASGDFIAYGDGAIIEMY